MEPAQAHAILQQVTGSRPSSVCASCNKQRPNGFKGCRREDCPWVKTSEE